MFLVAGAVRWILWDIDDSEYVCGRSERNEGKQKGLDIRLSELGLQSIVAARYIGALLYCRTSFENECMQICVVTKRLEKTVGV